MRLPNPIVALENGTMGWELAGLTLERGANRTAPAPGSKSRVQAAATAKRVAVEDGVKSLGVDDVRRLWDGRRERNVYLIDVRTADEYEADHVAGSIWAPGGQAVQATDDYFAVRGASYVFICDGFVRSIMTAAWFTRMGVPEVAVLAGGVSAWRDGGGLIEKRPARAGAVRLGRGPRRGALPEAGRARRRARGRRRHERRVRARARARRRLDLPQPARVEDRGRGARPHAADRPHVRGRRRLHARGGDARRLGYKEVSVLDGGTGAWADAGRPFEAGATRLWDEADDVVLKPYQRGREAMEAYLRWEEALDPDGTSPHRLLKDTPNPGGGSKCPRRSSPRTGLPRTCAIQT